MSLPGIGSYTARAVACFAYRRPVPVVDTNVRRVVARAVHGRADAGSPSAVRDEADVAALMPDDASAPRFSAALMELGATGLHGTQPAMRDLPAAACAWRDAGYPPPPARPGGFRSMRVPTGRCGEDCWMCCAATISRSPAASSTSRG